MNSLDIAHKLAAPFEGCILDPYHDPVGYPTIGYGHLLSMRPWADLSQWNSITQQQADDLLIKDLLMKLNGVRRLITVPLNKWQEAALIDFAFNCGTGNLKVSTLRKVINRGDYDQAPKQFMRWVFARGVKLNGLVRRRKAEADVWSTVPVIKMDAKPVAVRGVQKLKVA